MTMIGDDDDDAVLEAFDDPGDAVDVGQGVRRQPLLENMFGVQEDGGLIVLAKRPGARLELDHALNLAAWIVATAGVDFEDFEELVRTAAEGE
jgi:hypothetical protein